MYPVVCWNDLMENRDVFHCRDLLQATFENELDISDYFMNHTTTTNEGGVPDQLTALLTVNVVAPEANVS